MYGLVSLFCSHSDVITFDEINDDVFCSHSDVITFDEINNVVAYYGVGFG